VTGQEVEPVFVDTNVLVYLRDSRDLDRQRKCAEWIAYLWECRLGRISTQVLHEYYVTVTGRLVPGLPSEEARDDVMALQAWSPRIVSSRLTEDAWAVQDRWGFSFWDSLIVAAARAERSGVLLTEDLTHGQDLDGILIVSPFESAPGD
jgi:predicted nucleic acid-binding protein